MPRSLPQTPSLRFLQKEAKHLLKAHKDGSPSCCASLRYHFRFSRASDEEILKADVALQEVQHALALDYGFKSWTELKSHVDMLEAKNSSARSTDGVISEMLTTAVKDRASDIHVEPMKDHVRVRYRIDGSLYEMKPLASDLGFGVIDAIMKKSKMDPNQKKQSQDSRMLVDIKGKRIDIRVNVTPGIHGGVVAMRILDRSQVNLSLDRLEMEPDQLSLYRQQIGASHGIILVTGPTGSGTTTSLYATLMELNSPNRKIVTIEDPVEFALDGIDQIPIGLEHGFDFEQALRSVLRQAPNVIMAGEIRNVQTAQLLVQAAFTGHLVFSTLHTDGCIQTLTRLRNMGIEAYLIADAVKCIVAQRLVRCICDGCKVEYEAQPDGYSSLFGSDTDKPFPVYHGAGCDKCNGTGYHGRTGIYSILPMTSGIAEALVKNDTDSLTEIARGYGWTTLREAGIRKMRDGVTTPEEILKFT